MGGEGAKTGLRAGGSMRPAAAALGAARHRRRAVGAAPSGMRRTPGADGGRPRGAANGPRQAAIGPPAGHEGLGREGTPARDAARGGAARTADGPAPDRKGAADAWSAVAAYAGVVVAVFLFLVGLGGGLPGDRPPVGGGTVPAAGGAPVAGAAPSSGAAGSSAANPEADEPAVPALSPAFPGAAQQTGQAVPGRPQAGGEPASSLGGAGDGTGAESGAGGSRDAASAPGPGGDDEGADGAGAAPSAGGAGAGSGGASDPAPGSGGRAGGSGAEAEPDLWQALAERLWGWRAVLDAMWPGSTPPAAPGAQGGPGGAAEPPAGGQGVAPDPLGRRLADLLTETVAGVRLDEPLTLVASQFPGSHHLEIFEEEGGPVVGRLAPPDVLAGGLPRFRPAAAEEGGEVAVAGDQPRVLIYHTHTSEAYVGAVPAGTGFDPAVEAFTSDPGASVVGVGTVVQQVLEERGIGAVHLRQVFDRDGQRVTRIGNYQRSLAALAGDEGRTGLLDEYPTVDVVLDIHRDGVGRDATLTRVGGQPAASILFVVGTDRRLQHPQWHKNYCFVQWLVAELERRHPGLVKGVLVSENRYNQHVRPGALLVEIGGYGNTPQEAERSARMFAEALAAVIEAGKVPQADRPFQCPPGVEPPG